MVIELLDDKAAASESEAVEQRAAKIETVEESLAKAKAAAKPKAKAKAKAESADSDLDAILGK